MTLRDRLTEAMKAALKAGDKPRLSALRLMLAQIQQQVIATRNEALADDDVLPVLAKMIRQREEAAATYESGGRPELAAAERAEIAVIREFMPSPLSPEETRAAVQAAIAETGAQSLKDMGKVMAALKERHAGRMDYANAGAMVKERLSAKPS